MQAAQGRERGGRSFLTSPSVYLALRGQAKNSYKLGFSQIENISKDSKRLHKEELNGTNKQGIDLKV